MNEWISVKERLPDYGLCIIYVPDHQPSVYLDGYGEIASGFTKAAFAHEVIFKTKVSHWMPLPRPPEEK